MSMNATVRSLVHPQLRSEPFQPGLALKLSIGTLGFLNTLEFTEDSTSRADLGPYEVEIEARAWGLSFRGLFVSLSRPDGDDFGVCGIRTTYGIMRTYPRAPVTLVSKIPDTLSFEAAASILMPGITAYYSLIEVARLRRGDKILIHSASGSTGWMAIWIVEMIGVEMFVMVGFDDKKKLLMDNFGIPANHIFYSCNTTFAQGVMRATEGHGVDVLLNSLSSDGLRASWDCMALFGRFIEIGKADITSNATLPMAGFARNISFAAVDLHHVAQCNVDLLSALLKSAMELVASAATHHPSPLHVYSVSNVEQAFRYLQGSKNSGRIIISRFNAAATYVVSGGLGGLGGATIKRMADKGVKNLILPLRSSPASQAAARVVAELRDRGVRVETPACDVSSASELSAVLDGYAGSMPPIKGCINASMVLQDAIFENMSHAQTCLDFFVLLSSMPRSPRSALKLSSGPWRPKLARALSIAADDVQQSKQLSNYGVDSLMAVELRNWIARDFGVNVAVFEIMGSSRIAAIGALIAQKGDMKDGWKMRSEIGCII
ncbi:hypothetical protein B0T17DRAFT_591051 [Bombardia bombarda]|uniref:Carrier domain-containing protein n=1 Tax=Bombardia bombarda TaxID=252184 RepID=A0AA39X1D7_9PEZI|nr:hypothetical protein B0T17DRAFT_591051 [Bombardia bombarda]